MIKTNLAKIKTVSSILTRWVLVLYVIYGVFMGEVALNVKYNFIIIFVFLVLTFHVFISIKFKYEKVPFMQILNKCFKCVKLVDIIVLLFLVASGIWIFIIPKLNGFPISLAIQEAGILLILILYFPLAILVRMKEINFHLIIRSFMIATLILAIWYASIWSMEACFPGTYQGFFNLLQNIPGPLFKVGNIYKGWSSIRVVLANCILLVSGLIIILGKNKKYTIVDYLVIFIYSFAILCTYLKSIWIGLIVGIIVLVIFSIFKKDCRNANLWKGIVAICISMIILNFTVFGGSISTRLLNGFSNSYKTSQSDLMKSSSHTEPQKVEESSAETNQTVSSSNKELFEDKKIISDTIASNTEKLVQIKKLFDRWKQSPFIGFGYGSYIPNYLRSQTVIYAYEMTSFSLLMKNGIFGIAFWLMLLFVPCVNIYKKCNKKNMKTNWVLWLAVSMAYIVSIQTNPLLLTPNSINLILFLVLYSVNCELKERTN